MKTFTIQQGTDGGISWPVYNALTSDPVDFTGWTGVGQIRSLNTNAVLHTFSTSLGNMILEGGRVTLTWTGQETSTWTWKQANFGIEAYTPTGKALRVFQSIVTVSKEVVV